MIQKNGRRERSAWPGPGSLLLAALVLVTMPAAAATVTLHREGTVTHGEICRFPAADPDDPFRRWLGSQEVACTSSDSPVAFPAGLWNVFARSGTEAVSTLPRLIEGESAPSSLSLDLHPAATIAVDLPDGRAAVVYSPAHGSAFPVAGGSAVVPANSELWLFVVSRGDAEAMIVVPPLEPGTRRAVDARGSGGDAVVGWVQVPTSDRAAIAAARGLASPSVDAVSDETRVAARQPLDRLHGSFFRIAGVPPGRAELRLHGSGWLRTARPLAVKPGLTVVAQPVIAAASATLVVNWSAADGFYELNESLGSCEATPRPAEFELTLLACPGSRPGRPVERDDCSAVRTDTFGSQVPYGSVAAEGLVPGLYQAQLRFGDLPPVRSAGIARPAQQTAMYVTARYNSFYGSVTHGGEPVLEAFTVALPVGYGFAPEGKGEYRAAVTRMPGTDAQITIAACDGSPSAIVLTDRPLRPDSRNDFDIPGNRLTINVTDTFTREPLSGAVVRMEVIGLHFSRPVVMTRTISADADGTATLTAVPERELRLTVTHGGYEKQVVSPYSISRRETRTLDVQLVPLRGSRGRVVSSRPFESAAVFWFSPSGQELERADLAPDGTFVYANPHEPTEVMAVVSASHPLWVSRSPRLDLEGTATVAFPEVRPRTFSVSIPAADARQSRHIGVVIGGVRVPQPVLRQHQFLRGGETVTRGANPLPFLDLADTGPLEVLLGPRVEDVRGVVAGLDLFALPELADVPRQPVPPGVTSIEFR